MLIFLQSIRLSIFLFDFLCLLMGVPFFIGSIPNYSAILCVCPNGLFRRVFMNRNYVEFLFLIKTSDGSLWLKS